MCACVSGCVYEMLACLPGPGDLSLQLHPHSQMNTGFQKCECKHKTHTVQTFNGNLHTHSRFSKLFLLIILSIKDV